MVKRIQRGAMWMVDLSSQYWMALLTVGMMSFMFGDSLGLKSMGFML